MRVRVALVAVLALCVGGCLFMPRKGRPVWVESSQGDYWSGEGMLTERTDDGRNCKVHVRNSAGVVEAQWLDCRHVHPRAR